MGISRGYLRFIDSCKIGNKIYFLNQVFNGMFYFDINDLTIHFVCQFSNEKYDAISLSSTSISYKNMLYFFPAKAKAIMGYDLLEQKEKILSLQYFFNKNCMISGVVRIKDIVYMFPADLGEGIFTFHLEEQKVNKDRKLSELFLSGFLCGNVLLSHGHDSCILISMYGGNQLVEINLNTKKIIYTKKFEEKMQIYSVCFDGKNYWILQINSTDIYEWNIMDDTLYKYKNVNIVWGNYKSIPYSNLVFLDDEILVLNCHLKHILHINKEKRIIEKPVELPEGFQPIYNKFPGRPVCEHYTILEDKVLIYPGVGNMMLIYYKAARRMLGKDISVSPNEDAALCIMVKENYMRQELLRESNELWSNLEDFIYLVGVGGISNKRQSDKTKEIGYLLYEKCKNM